MPTWLEVSLIVDGELAEAVAEVLARFTADSVVIESTAVTAGADDSEGRTIGPLRVAAYLPVDERIEETRRKLEESLWYLGRIRPLPPAQFQVIQQADWSQTWKQHYRPILIGRHLVIVPAWLENPDPSRISIRIDPGMAFGTGTHPTTQLCLELIERIFTEERPTNLIDVGCGTAILAISALKLGADFALAVDIDPEALGAAQENALANEVAIYQQPIRDYQQAGSIYQSPKPQIEIALGSLAEIQAGNFSVSQAPLVLANILAPVLVRLLDENLAEIVTPGGYLILSGILADQSPEVEEALSRHNLRLAQRRQIDDWIALCARRD